MASLKEWQRASLAITPKVSGLLSSIGSSYICIDLWCVPEERQKLKKSTYHRIVFILSFWDIINSFVMFLSTWPIPKEIETVYGASGTWGTCLAQGFLGQISNFTPLYNAVLGIYFVLTVRYRWKRRELRNLEIASHILTTGLAVGTSVAALYMNLYNEANFWCWIAPYPRGCTSTMSGFDEGDIPCTRGDNAEMYQFVFYYFWIFLSWIIVITCMGLLYATTSQDAKRMSKYASASMCDRNRRDAAIMGLLYIWAFFISYTFLSAARVIKLINPSYKMSYGMMLMSMITRPLQGIWNVLIYLAPRFMKLKRKQPKTALRTRIAGTLHAFRSSRRNASGRFQHSLQDLTFQSSIRTQGSSTKLSMYANEFTASQLAAELSANGLANEVSANDVAVESSANGIVNEVSGNGLSNEVSGNGCSNEVSGNGCSNEVSGKGCSNEVSGNGLANEVSGNQVAAELSANDATIEVSANGLADVAAELSANDAVNKLSGNGLSNESSANGLAKESYGNGLAKEVCTQGINSSPVESRRRSKRFSALGFISGPVESRTRNKRFSALGFDSSPAESRTRNKRFSALGFDSSPAESRRRSKRFSTIATRASILKNMPRDVWEFRSSQDGSELNDVEDKCVHASMDVEQAIPNPKPSFVSHTVSFKDIEEIAEYDPSEDLSFKSCQVGETSLIATCMPDENSTVIERIVEEGTSS